jgi:hypothetical protein
MPNTAPQDQGRPLGTYIVVGVIGLIGALTPSNSSLGGLDATRLLDLAIDMIPEKRGRDLDGLGTEVQDHVLTPQSKDFNLRSPLQGPPEAVGA